MKGKFRVLSVGKLLSVAKVDIKLLILKWMNTLVVWNLGRYLSLLEISDIGKAVRELSLPASHQSFLNRRHSEALEPLFCPLELRVFRACWGGADRDVSSGKSWV